jgi:signal peptidase II
VLYFILSICLIVIDQLVKWWVRGAIPLGTSIPFIPYLMDLTYTQNTGAAFSSFSGMTWLLTLVSLGASVAVAALLWKNYFPGAWGKLSLALILAGAVGNLIDRAFLGFVTDMFETTFMNFAVFNVADICVVVGGFLMAVYVLLLWDKDKEAGNDPA